MTAPGLMKDTIVLISGGTHGLGAGIARHAAAEGAAGIAITGRSVEAGAKIAKDLTALGTPTAFLPTDLADTQQASSTVARTIAGGNIVNIGWTATDGEDLIQRRFHGAGDDWLEKANASVPMERRSATLSCLPKVPAGSTVDLRRALARLELT